MSKISLETIKRWAKLDSSSLEKFTHRANKTLSTKRIFPVEYLDNPKNLELVKEIVSYIDEKKVDLEHAIVSLCVNRLKQYRLHDRKHVYDSWLGWYADIPPHNERFYGRDDYLYKIKLPEDETDFIGMIYQTYLFEGEKNLNGIYYTPSKIVRQMIGKYTFDDKEMFLDPCCGSGAFLLNANAALPYHLCGIDKDPLAVIIAKTNLLIKYQYQVFKPDIFVYDFLDLSSWGRKFDYIATNPPWGAEGSSESFSQFFTAAYNLLKPEGKIRFLFPESVLTVKKHRDLRKFILNHANLGKITKHQNKFSGVMTDYVDMECKRSYDTEAQFCNFNGKDYTVEVEDLLRTKDYLLLPMERSDVVIIHQYKSLGRTSLINSQFGLGIVTGDNKNKLLTQWRDGAEPIYTGKDIHSFVLDNPIHYIVYDRNKLQQVAPDELYRAKEKLIYRFISKIPVFAYDNNRTLCLNSANILIPKVPTLSTKTVLAFLNSSLFRFIYVKLFSGIKVLKGSLIQLLFPELLESDDKQFVELVDRILCGHVSVIEEVDKLIFEMYHLTDDHISHIKQTLNDI